MHRHALIVGHTQEDQGAYAPDPLDLAEWAFNDAVVDHQIANNAFPEQLLLRKFHRRHLPGNVTNRYGKEMAELFRRVNAWCPTLTVDHHFNAFGTDQYGGYEVLSSGSSESRRAAHAYLDQGAQFTTANRGIKLRGPGDRGGRSLHSAPCPSILLEPFNKDHPFSVQAIADLGTEGLGQIYLNAQYYYCDLLRPTLKAALPGPTVENPPAPAFVFDSLPKDDWFLANKAAIAALPISASEFCGIAYAELGLNSQGHVDPLHVHSLGEVGPLPLPGNYEYWTGERLPEHLTPSENVRAFAGYLEGIKRSSVYRHLFEDCQTDAEKTKVLAGAVHGWYYAPNFDTVPGLDLTGRDVALCRQAIAYAARQSDGDEPGMILTLLEEIRYKHGSDLLVNRLRNLDRGLDIAAVA